MFKPIPLLLSGLFLISSFCIAQTNGILPLTGMQYFSEGIFAKYAEINIDGSTLINNRIPVNKEFTLKLQLPSGFTEDAAKKVYPAAEVSFLSVRKQSLANMGNLLKENESSGFAVAGFKELNLKLSIRTEWLKYETDCIIQVRYYDLKSKKQMRILFPVSIATAAEPMTLSKFSAVIKTSDQSLALSNALTMNTAEIGVDTSIRVSPKTAYLSIEIPKISGTSMEEVLNGKNSFWIYDKDMNEIKIAEKLLKKVGGSMESGLVNYTVKVPFKLKTDTKEVYTIRYRWESADRKKVMDIVSSK